MKFIHFFCYFMITITLQIVFTIASLFLLGAPQHQVHEIGSIVSYWIPLFLGIFIYLILIFKYFNRCVISILGSIMVGVFVEGIAMAIAIEFYGA